MENFRDKKLINNSYMLNLFTFLHLTFNMYLYILLCIKTCLKSCDFKSWLFYYFDSHRSKSKKRTKIYLE